MLRPHDCRWPLRLYRFPGCRENHAVARSTAFCPPAPARRVWALARGKVSEHAQIDTLRAQGRTVAHVPHGPDEAHDPLRSMAFHWREAQRALDPGPDSWFNTGDFLDQAVMACRETLTQTTHSPLSHSRSAERDKVAHWLQREDARCLANSCSMTSVPHCVPGASRASTKPCFS